MSKKYIEQKLTLKRIYVIYSEKTKNIYINQEDAAIIFFDELDANNFVKNNLQTFLKKERFYKGTDLFNMFYRLGIYTLDIHDEDEIYNIRVTKFKCDNNFYNSNLNFQILKTKQYNTPAYMSEILSQNCIVPFRVENISGHHPHILSVDAKISNGKTMIPVFSDLQEFEKWNQEEWQPVLFEMKKLISICKDGIILNPAGNMLVLNKETIEQYR